MFELWGVQVPRVQAAAVNYMTPAREQLEAWTAAAADVAQHQHAGQMAIAWAIVVAAEIARGVGLITSRPPEPYRSVETIADVVAEDGVAEDGMPPTMPHPIAPWINQ